MTRSTTFALVVSFTACTGGSRPASRPDDWPVTGGDPGNSRFSALDQITRANVAQLRVAWTYHTGDAPAGHSEMQATPIVVNGVMYTSTPALKVVALRADSGTALWTFDPFARRTPEPHVNRGVVLWGDGRDRRILFTAGRRLYALDAATGIPIRSFGDSGWVDLGAGLGRDVSDAAVVATSPGVIYHDLLIQGTRVGEGEGSAPGHVRAYDVRTGTVQWTFHTIPQPGEAGSESWPTDAWKTAGGANSWPGMSVDVERGLVYVPTGSATPDFYGGDRPGQSLYANTLLALDARTGVRQWHFQTVHHDIWDRDLPAAPNLLTVTRDGQRVDAVAQITKSGFVYLFNRETGVPLFPVTERAVPGSALPGEQAWPTQPIPDKPAPFARQGMTEADLTTLTPEAHEAVLKRFRTLRHDGLFAPPSRAGTIVLPGFDGGGEWGGAAIDRAHGVLFVNASDVPWIAAMRDRAVKLAAESRTPSTSPYEFVGYERWKAPDGYPAIRPPWGTLSAIDLNTGEYRWRIPLGVHRELSSRGVAPTGTEQYGGPIATAGGLVIIAATQDAMIRAFDSASGALLWEAPLPAAGYATPSTYRVGGKQYLVIACGGGKLGSPSGDAYVAFALP